MKPSKAYHVNEISISYKPVHFIEETIQVLTSKDAYDILQQFYDAETLALQEQFVVLYLNRRSSVIGVYPMSKGGITGTVADVRLILSVALKAAASSIVLSHNHPSGGLRPSNQDIELTRKIKQAASFMDIDVSDHIILGKENFYFSFIDEGFL